MPRSPARCGTDSGYYRHKRTTKTEVCAACRAAHAAAHARRVQINGRPKRSPAKPPMTCVTCGSPSYANRCRPCANRVLPEVEKQRRIKRQERAAAELVYDGDWVRVRGVLRPTGRAA